MPAMIVWPVSSSVWTRKVGSSSASFASAMPSLSCSALVFGSIAMAMTGSGKTIDSRRIGWSLVAERVAGGGVLEADGGDDVAGEDLLDVLAVVGVHLQEAADALLVALGGVEHVATRRSCVPE